MSNRDPRVNAYRSALPAFVIPLLLLYGADQLTKLLAACFLKGRAAVPLIPDVFELYYLENHGAAFGMMRGLQWLFILFALAIAAAAFVLFARLPGTAYYLPLKILCVTLSAGALGNMTDRIVHRYVIDFLYFSLIDFPVFNVADIYVCVSAGLLLILLIFYYKDEDLAVFMRPDRGKVSGEKPAGEDSGRTEDSDPGRSQAGTGPQERT